MERNRILVAEDEGISALEIKSSLTELGYEVVSVVSRGEDAVSKAVELVPDLVLMDIKLAGDMNGIEAARIIRGALDVPVVYLTANADESTIEQARVSQPYGFLIKPFNILAVNSTIQMALYKHEADIQRKQAEEIARRAKGEWEHTFDAMTDIVMITDADYRVVKANRAFRDAFSLTAAEIEGEKCYKVLNCDNKQSACLYKKVIAEGKEQSGEINFGARTYLCTVSPVFASEGVINGAIHVGKDITEIKKMHEALVQSEKRLNDITSSIAEGIYVMDRQGHLVFMNPEAERLLGWALEELDGGRIHDLIHYKKADGTPLPLEECPIHNVIMSGRSFVSSDEVFVRKDGAIFPVSVVASPIMEDGIVVASVTAFRDISIMKDLEKERGKLIAGLTDALAKVKQLSGLLPICASCKKIRDDKGYWTQIESYIHEHSEAEFSHGICPGCAKKLYPQYYGKGYGEDAKGEDK